MHGFLYKQEHFKTPYLQFQGVNQKILLSQFRPILHANVNIMSPSTPNPPPPINNFYHSHTMPKKTTHSRAQAGAMFGKGSSRTLHTHKMFYEQTLEVLYKRMGTLQGVNQNSFWSSFDPFCVPM